MTKKKINFSYWELPEWENKILTITNITERNGKIYLTLRAGETIYKIKKPKSGGFDDVKIDDIISVTKTMYAKMNARLTMQPITASAD